MRLEKGSLRSDVTIFSVLMPPISCSTEALERPPFRGMPYATIAPYANIRHTHIPYRRDS